MNKNKAMKWIIKLLMLYNVYLIGVDVLVIAKMAQLQELHLPAIYFTLFTFCVACLIIKNRYWILAFVFKALHTFVIALASWNIAESGTDLRRLPAVAVALGIFFLLLSLFSFAKLLQIPDLVSEEHTYLWMQKLNEHMKKKKHR